MKTPIPVLILAAFAATALPGRSVAHEVWLAPEPYEADPGAPVAAHLKNGDKFAGMKLPYNDGNFQRFERWHGGGKADVGGRLGDRPAFRNDGLAAGLHVVIYQSEPAWVRYAKWEKFARFAAHKDFPDIAARHDARGLPRDGIVEAYGRFAKTLIAVGDGEGEDLVTGMETEIVALENPYTSDSGELPVRVLYRGEPRADVQVELFDRAPDGKVAITLHRTDADGVAILPVERGHEYLVDAVLLREPVPAEGIHEDAVWQTLWASLTFAKP